MTLNQESNKQPILQRAFLPNGWPDRENVEVAAIRITAGLAALVVFVALATYVCTLLMSVTLPTRRARLFC